MPRFIDPVLQARIQTELDAIERKETIRIVLAVESGSRAWGFPSRDSDYDVRFLYVGPIESYLTVTPRRDVIERPIDAILDINGWDPMVASTTPRAACNIKSSGLAVLSFTKVITR